MYFNPHHHAGGDICPTCQLGIFHISIHTTTQVVTPYPCLTGFLHGISIHTTTQVVTEGDGERDVAPYISIHTTTQVVTNMRSSMAI